jgi:hypothetical protein
MCGAGWPDPAACDAQPWGEPAGLLQKKFERFADVPRAIRDAGPQVAELVFPGLYWIEGSCGLGAEQDAQTETLL